MTDAVSGLVASDATRLALDERVVAALRVRLPFVAAQTVAAVTEGVPGYAGALTGSMGENIENAVQLALGTFLKLAEQSRESDPSTPLQPALEGAYALGRGEARSGRTMDALLSAYRVGARVSWRELSATAVETGLSAARLAEFAELVFAYIDELSAASVAGHSDELATTGRVRERYLERLARSLLAADSAEVLVAAAERADWDEPTTLTAVLLPVGNARAALGLLDPRTLAVGEDAPGLPPDADLVVLLVPDMAGRDRKRLFRVLKPRHAVVGPPRPWMQVQSSYLRALRGRDMAATDDDIARAFDTESHLVELVIGADPEALADLRKLVLAPFEDLRPATAERLSDTLRSWLLHQGRRDEVAAELFVHPQTVRYRMGQIRELYGERLDDPHTVLELLIALRGERRRSQE